MAPQNAEQVIKALTKRIEALEKELKKRSENLDKRLAKFEKHIKPGPTLELNAPTVSVKSAMVTFSGTVKAKTVIADTVCGTNYTPGAGNVM